MPRGRPFKPGQSGNPSGRPKDVGHVREIARKHTEAAISALVEIVANGKPDRARVAAAEAILDRGYGRPTQPIEGGDQPIRFHDLSKLSRKELDQLEKLVGKVDADG